MKTIPIEAKEAYPWLLLRHYAKRIPPITFAFGLFDDSGKMVGVVTYGTPSSSPLREGVCGPEWASCVLELNRLCCDGQKNSASRLVSASLRMLPQPSIVVSYADTSAGHVGYVYQAANFLYTGLSAKRTDWTLDGHEGKHGQTVADMSRGKENRAQWMRETFGNAFSLRERPRKHRYIYLVGSKRQRREMAAALRYKIEKFPKGDTRKHNETSGLQSQTRFSF